jgi:hypothetical protein
MIVKMPSVALLAMALVPCRAQSLKTSTPVVVMQVQSCNFAFKDFFHGSISKPGVDNEFRAAGYSANIPVRGSSKTFGFDLTCHEHFSNVNEVASHFGGRLNNKTSIWTSDFGEASKKDIVQLRLVTKTFPLKSKNGHGFYTIQDDLDGEPKRRLRHLSYCLFHAEKALCGYGVVKRLIDSKSDMLPYARGILRTVEFTAALGATGERKGQ